MQQPLPRIDLLAPQADQFRDTQPVPIGQQDHRGIAVAMAAESLGGGESDVQLHLGDTKIKLRVPDKVHAEVEVEVERDEVELEIELKWSLAAPHTARKAAAST